MKKLLSLILAIIMIVSTVPMAFAVEFDEEAYVDAATKLNTYLMNLYESDETSTHAEKTGINFIYVTCLLILAEQEYPELENIDGDIESLKSMPEAANALTAVYQEAVRYFEDLIASGQYVVQVDTSEWIAAEYTTKVYYSDEQIDALIAKVPAELTAQAEQAKYYYEEVILSDFDDTIEYSQADFDKDMAVCIAYWTQVNNCLGGKHSISYNPATDNGDGTHTFTCAFCTDIATVEHSFIDGKCVCGVEEPATDDGNDEVVEDKTETEEDNNTNADDNTQTPEKTNFVKRIVQAISNFFKGIMEKLRGLVKR